MWGRRAIPGVLIGHLSIWLHFGPSATVLLAPLLYTFEAWTLAYLAFKLKVLEPPERSSMDRTAWRLLLAPWLAALPVTAIVGWLASTESRYPGDSMLMVSSKIAMAHVHGMIAFGPLTIHLLRRDFSLEAEDRRLTGLLGFAGAFVLMWIAFHGGFANAMSMNSAAFLSFPLIVMTGLWWPPPVISLFMMSWCLSTTLLTGAGHGPFNDSKGDVHPLELGIYNLITCSTAYLISAGSTRFLRQAKRNELGMLAAGVETWEWNLRHGVRSFHGDSGRNLLRAIGRFAHPLDSLSVLSGSRGKSRGKIPESWQTRIEPNPGESEILMSTGHITSRDHKGQPKSAVGLVQDLSAVRRAEEALIALGHQRAQLKSLQSRLNPHFLFNALNALRALIHLDPDQASHAVTTLARLLRSNLKNSERALIPLAEEMDLVRDLLEISKTRFGDRLETTINIAVPGMTWMVPPMAVFNLVENALVHGIEKQSGPGTISIDAQISGNLLHVQIRNPGRLEPNMSAGTGTRDVAQRIELLFGGAGRFQLLQETDTGVLANLHLPHKHHESANC